MNLSPKSWSKDGQQFGYLKTLKIKWAELSERVCVCVRACVRVCVCERERERESERERDRVRETE